MTKFISIFLALSVLVIVVESQADNRKTPIDENTYKVAMRSCYEQCSNKSDNPRMITFCSCSCMTMSVNMRQVVQKHNLHYEEDMLQYIGEISLTTSQVDVCKERASR